MKNTDYFKGKKITIVGFARSGLACANLLQSIGADVSITDIQDNSNIRLNASKLNSQDIQLELGRHTREFIIGRDMVVISPGVEDSAQPVIWAKELNIPLVSEIEIGGILCPATIIAVTGSNGKTTVTTLIGKILEAAGKKVFTCGNIGNAFCGEITKMQEEDFVVLEISSFQLEHIKTFHPKVALILNFSRNHLDRYKDMQEYISAKKRIFMNQNKDDFFVLNAEDAISQGLEHEVKAGVLFFSRSARLSPNQAAAAVVAGIFGIDKEISYKVFREFKGIEHRFEFVAEVKGVKFINDSKATTVESCRMALDNLAGPVILIAGGRHKGVDYRTLLPSARNKIKEAILIGEAKENISGALKGEFPLNEATSLEEAVNQAYEKANPGDCVLLSPMCSSFDMFSSYEERGKVFKKAVLLLAKNNN
ncbi:MAG: Mur ligase family protein [Candidatus Omnitrophica bacterium]|nr:Mur ligase family protein [Candidatus Omnitrophota bacterium]